MAVTLNGQTGFVVTDVGSTTTKAVYFKGAPEWRFFRAESPTTVEKPYEDVTVGVVRALEALEAKTGERTSRGAVLRHVECGWRPGPGRDRPRPEDNRPQR
jgi:hypothetical protein